MSLTVGLMAFALIQSAADPTPPEQARRCAVAAGAMRGLAMSAGEPEAEARWKAATRSWELRLMQATPDRRSEDILHELASARLARVGEAMESGSLRSLHQEAVACEAALRPRP